MERERERERESASEDMDGTLLSVGMCDVSLFAGMEASSLLRMMRICLNCSAVILAFGFSCLNLRITGCFSQNVVKNDMAKTMKMRSYLEYISFDSASSTSTVLIVEMVEADSRCWWLLSMFSTKIRCLPAKKLGFPLKRPFLAGNQVLKKNWLKPVRD